jgi:hypothetical protein
MGAEGQARTPDMDPESQVAPKAPPPLPGTVAPDETPKPKSDGASTAQNFGLNNRELPEKLQQALRRLKNDYKSESIATRLQEVKRVVQARNFWKGLQDLVWSETEGGWRLPFEQSWPENISEEEYPRYAFVTNFYQAFGLSIIAVLSQSIPRTRLMPSNAQDPKDIATATASSDIVKLVERNNDAQTLLTEIAFIYWTDGKVGTYTRFVVDGQKYGFDESPQYADTPDTVNLGQSMYHCMDCGQDTPADELGPQEQQEAPGQELDAEGQPGEMEGMKCPNCQTPMGPENLVAAPVTQIPRQIGTTRIPRGQERIDVVGSLELKTPVWAHSQDDFPYLIWVTEVHRAKLRAIYPWVAKKLQQGSSPGEQGSDTYERQARIRMATTGADDGNTPRTGGMPGQNLDTYERIWLRTWSFYNLDDEATRDELLAAFPDGAMCAFVGDTYCESRNENLDDHWVVSHALPGNGQDRPAIGGSLISVQERYNTTEDLKLENIEYGIPETYADPKAVDFDARGSTASEPGAMYPAKKRPGEALSNSFFQTAPSQLPAGVEQFGQDLMGPTAQFLTGALPALFGGDMANVDTASGYNLAKNQAMGRIGVIYRSLKRLWAYTMMNAVECFRANRNDDTIVSMIGEGGQFEAKAIRTAALKGSIEVYEETDEQFPTLQTEQRGILDRMMQSEDAEIQRILGDPENVSLIKRLSGLTDLVIPEEVARNKQHREITEMENSGPTQGMLPNGQQTVESSVPIDMVVDDHVTEAATCRRWLMSENGQAAKVSNPPWYANVRAHMMAHEAAGAQQTASSFPTQTPAGPPEGQSSQPTGESQ